MPNVKVQTTRNTPLKFGLQFDICLLAAGRDFSIHLLFGICHLTFRISKKGGALWQSLPLLTGSMQFLLSLSSSPWL
jgi:hypothetical protein